MIVQILIPSVLILIAIFSTFFLYIHRYKYDGYHYIVDVKQIIDDMEEAREQNRRNEAHVSTKFTPRRYQRQGNRSIK